MGSTSPFYKSGNDNNRRCVYCNRIFTDILPKSSPLPMCPECVMALGKTDDKSEEYKRKYMKGYAD